MSQGNEFVEKLRALERRSVRQLRLLALFDRTDRTKDDDDLVHALINAERTLLDAREASARVANTLAKRSGKERRERTRELIEFGGLAPIAGVLKHDRATVLGALMAIRDADAETTARWQAAGREALARSESAKRRRREQA